MSTHAKETATRPTHWDDLTAEAQRDRRREPRLKLPFPIEVYGFSVSGHYFQEKTATLNVSAGGCMIELKHEIEPLTVLAIRRVSRDGTRSEEHRPVLFEVCWVDRSGRRWTVGARKMQAGDLWGLSGSQNAAGN